MFKYPYDTTPLASHVVKGIVTALQHAMVDDQLRTAQTLKKNVVEGMVEVPSYLKAVPQFSHPMAFEHFGKTIIAIDTRPFVSDTRDGSIKINNGTEYQFMVLRGILTKAWTEGSPSDFMSLGDIAPRAFIRMVSEGVSRRLDLNPLDQQSLTVVTAFYYLGQFMTPESSDGVLTEGELLKVASRISRLTMIPAATTLALLTGAAIPADVHSFCALARDKVASPRLEKFNPGLLYAIISGGWFGAAAREVVAVSFEHPPTFVAMVYMALTDRSYHSAYITKLIQAVDRNNLGKQFQANVVSLLEAFAHV